MRRHRPENKVSTELNVTNLLDTTLVLLLAFMIVTPTLKSGVDLKLPEVDEKAQTPLEADPKKTLSISISKPLMEGLDPRVMVEEKQVDLGGLRDAINRKLITHPDVDVIIESDQSVSYGEFMKVLGVVKAAGIENIGLPTDPSKTEEKK